MEKTVPQRLLAEAIGAMALVFVAAGAVMVNDVGVPGVGLLGVAFAYGLAIATMVSALGHVSGAHFNPAVTIGVWIAQKIKTADAVLYVAAQAVGAVVGAALLRVALPSQIYEQGASGTPAVAVPTISNGQAVLIEAILTFFLVWVVFATAVDPDGAFGKVAGLTIGFVIVMGTLMGGPFTGAAMNPVRHLGPGTIFGQWTGWWVYWVGPVAGGIVAAALYDGVILKRRDVLVTETGETEEIHGFAAHGEGDHTVRDVE